MHVWMSVTEGNVEWCSVSSTRHYLSLGDSGKDKRQFTLAITVICNVDNLWDCFDSSVERNLLLSCLLHPSHRTVMIWRTENKTSEELGGNRTVMFVLAGKILFSTKSKKYSPSWEANGSWASQKRPTFYETHRSIAVLKQPITCPRHESDKSSQHLPPTPIYFKWSLSLRFSHQNPISTSLVPHSSWFDHLDHIC
jgi:hypothetical protein